MSVIVAGSIITDMSVLVNKHPQVGETVMGDNLSYSPGGKGANQAVAAARLGANTLMVGCVGDDSFGKEALDFISSQGILCLTHQGDGPTGIAMIVVDENTGNNNIVVIPGANMELTPDYMDKLTYRKGDVLVSQFEIPLSTVKRFFHKGKHSNCINVLNPAPAIINDQVIEILNLTDVLIVNETELEVLAGATLKQYEIHYHHGKGFDYLISRIIDKLQTPPSVVIVTLGDKGVYTYMTGYPRQEKEKNTTAISFQTAGVEVRVKDTTGAGDCFVGAFAKTLDEGGASLLDPILIWDGKLQESVDYANHAAAMSVCYEGSGKSMPTKEGLDFFMVKD